MVGQNALIGNCWLVHQRGPDGLHNCFIITNSDPLDYKVVHYDGRKKFDNISILISHLIQHACITSPNILPCTNHARREGDNAAIKVPKHFFSLRAQEQPDADETPFITYLKNCVSFCRSLDT